MQCFGALHYFFSDFLNYCYLPLFAINTISKMNREEIRITKNETFYL